ncbi:hypothetical protein [Lunatimonas salinarum]|uniref:hypothetical protein n=1 Tax=Lunatimonas salinarum TaxID=1774590 RepID=UPI001ADF3E4C|nr:hypothetical protein [Lunatimonas salinarum]
MALRDIFEIENVFFDPNSSYEFEELNESLYIHNLVLELEKEMGQRFGDFDFHIFSEHKTGKLPVSKDNKSGRKKVLLYFSDESAKDVSSYASNYFAIFKSYIGEKRTAENIFPLGIGYVRDVPVFPMKEVKQRGYDVFFQGNLNKNRIDFYRSFSPHGSLLPSQRFLKSDWYRKLLLKLSDNFNGSLGNSILAFNSGFKSGLDTAAYGKVLSESKIILCPRGFTQTECFRHYEGMRAGCVIVSERLPNIPFYRNSPIIQVRDWRKGIDIVKKLLKDPEELHAIQQATIQWWKEVCSEQGMAHYIYNCLKEVDSKKQ